MRGKQSKYNVLRFSVHGRAALNTMQQEVDLIVLFCQPRFRPLTRTLGPDHMPLPRSHL